MPNKIGGMACKIEVIIEINVGKLPFAAVEQLELGHSQLNVPLALRSFGANDVNGPLGIDDEPEIAAMQTGLRPVVIAAAVRVECGTRPVAEFLKNAASDCHDNALLANGQQPFDGVQPFGS